MMVASSCFPQYNGSQRTTPLRNLQRRNPILDEQRYCVTFPEDAVSISVTAGTTVLAAAIAAGLKPDAPCGGRGTCGKCLVRITAGRDHLTMAGGPVPGDDLLPACQLMVGGDVSAVFPRHGENRILTGGISMADTAAAADGEFFAMAAFDVGTTSLVGYLLDGRTGGQLAVDSRLNPQTQFGADVVARGSYAMEHGVEPLTAAIREALNEMLGNLCHTAHCRREDVRLISAVGNTCMHHLLLGYSPAPLMVAPYMPQHRAAEVRPGKELGFHMAPDGRVRILPCIAGFVGADTVGCLLACGWDHRDPLTLMIDIGTNGEMVLGNRRRSVTCSTAAGPAFEGAKIRFGMRGADGAIDHVFTGADGSIGYSVVGGGEAQGICGSGLLDAVAVLLELGVVDETGRFDPDGPAALGLADGKPAYYFNDTVCLTQSDIREVQLAKAAIAAGIRLLCDRLGVAIGDIEQVLIAGAFGNYMSPDSACAIGLLPKILREKIIPVGNAAGEGAKLAVREDFQFELASRLAGEVEFLELANDPRFQDIFVDELSFDSDEEED